MIRLIIPRSQIVIVIFAYLIGLSIQSIAAIAPQERCDSLFWNSESSIQVFSSEMFQKQRGLSFFSKPEEFNFRHFNPALREEYYPSVFQKLSSYYENNYTLTIVSSVIMAKAWKKMLEKDLPKRAVVYLPDILLDQNLEVLQSGYLQSYRHLILVNPEDINFVHTKVNTIIDLRPVYLKSDYENVIEIYRSIHPKQDKHLVMFIDTENTPKWFHAGNLKEERSADIPTTAAPILAGQKKPEEELSLELPENLRKIGKPYFPQKIDLEFYNQLNQFFLTKLEQTDIYQILPQASEDNGLYSKLVRLKFSYPLGWWMPLSPKVIRFLDQWHLKGKFQDAVDHLRKKELSNYIVQHQNETQWIPPASERSELSMWFHNFKDRHPEWWKELQPEALPVAQKKIMEQLEFEKQKEEKQKHEEEQNAKFLSLLDLHIQAHAQEVDPRFVLPIKANHPELKAWLDLRKKRVSTRKNWWKGLSEKSIEILTQRHLILPVWDAVRKERYEFLSAYIIEHQSEKEDWKLFPTELGDFKFTKWLNEQVVYFPDEWAQPLSEEARSVLEQRKLLKIQTIPVQDQNQINYRLLDAYIQSHANESDVRKILPRTRESNELGDWLAHLKYHHPDDWWAPLSKESIEVLEKNYLKGSVQVAVDRRRAAELSQYILLHRNERKCLPSSSDPSPMGKWYHRQKEKGSMVWIQYLSDQALQILRERKIISEVSQDEEPSE